MVEKRRQLSSLENSYLELTEHLVRQYGLSLGVFAKPVKRKPRMVKAISPPPITYQPEHLLTSEQAAAILGLRSKTLANWRVQGVEKLPFRRIGGAVRYQYGDLLTFIEARKHENTSQY
ncbi:helix-turn-helix domain-containing protein [Bacillus sp. PR5]|nr:helix-turn-helix domain-containing protein [Bacillus sp. PR5]